MKILLLFLFSIYFFSGCEVPIVAEKDQKEKEVYKDRYVDRYNTSNACEGLNLDVSIFNPWIARAPDEYFSIDFRGATISDTAWKTGLRIKFYLSAAGLQRINDYGRNATGLRIGDQYECEYWLRVPLNLPPFGVISTLKEGIFYLHHPDINFPQDNVCLEMIGTGGATFGYNILGNHTYKVEGTKLTLKFFGGSTYDHPVLTLDLDCIE